MARRKSAVKHYEDTIKRFKTMNLTMNEGAELIRQNLQRDLKEFTEGANPQGKARLRWLARLGHPYGRRDSGRQRGSSKYQRGSRAGKSKGSARLLPIGNISGRLQSARFTKKSKSRGSIVITAGFNKKAGNSLYVLLPQGTKKMVGRGLWGKNHAGALGKRVKMYKKAFREYFLSKQRKT